MARASATFYLTIFLVLFVLEMSGALVLDAEAARRAPTSRRQATPCGGATSTITTVGYGDQFPVTPWGRVIGVFLLTAGVALFSVFTGFIANALPRAAAAAPTADTRPPEPGASRRSSTRSATCWPRARTTTPPCARASTRWRAPS